MTTDRCKGKVCKPAADGRQRKCNPATGRCKLIEAAVKKAAVANAKLALALAASPPRKSPTPLKKSPTPLKKSPTPPRKSPALPPSIFMTPPEVGTHLQRLGVFDKLHEVSGTNNVESALADLAKKSGALHISASALFRLLPPGKTARLVVCDFDADAQTIVDRTKDGDFYMYRIRRPESSNPVRTNKKLMERIAETGKFKGNEPIFDAPQHEIMLFAYEGITDTLVPDGTSRWPLFHEECFWTKKPYQRPGKYEAMYTWVSKPVV